MSRKRIAALAFFLLIVVAVSLFFVRQSHLRREQRQREQLVALSLSKLSAAIKRGMTRAEVDAYLNDTDTGFFQRPTPGLPVLNDLAPLGQRPSGVWYCGPVQFGVEVDFKPSGPHSATSVLGSSTDTVSGIQPYEWYDDCL
jgi:hypothetical protein